MDRDRIAAEHVDGQNIELGRATIRDILFHREPRVARDDIDLSARISEKSKVAVRVGRDCDNGRVDLVIADVIAELRVRRNRTSPETDYADAQPALVGIWRGCSSISRPIPLRGP
jgi:hypothetical protein